jgi:ParB family transcriptional regulator, chromosome partitioning protein
MTLGRGLSSLIPPSNSDADVSEEKSEKYAPSSLENNAKITSTTLPSVSVGGIVKDEISQPIDEVDLLVPDDDNSTDLDSKNNLSSDEEVGTEEAIFQIEIDKIVPNPYQPRRHFDEESMLELAQSIQEVGIIQPLIVSKVEENTDTGTRVTYQLIAGERRLRASKRVGLLRVPAVVRRGMTNKANLELAIIENIQRSDLNPIESGRAYARLQDEFGLTQREISSRVGKSRESVANTLRLLNAPSYIQEAVGTRKINESQARVLIGIEDPIRQKRMFEKLVNEKMSVRRLKEDMRDNSDPENDYFEKRLEERIGAPVTISRKGSKGQLVIRFFSDEELRGILKRLGGGEE